ncbi:hypothetical protein V494_03629 [Pseudogymnoascus sp. VKM F-4513 (FW-928)]|nr:hypothetical protein V494_03629 [Pseudogymnoascus sp. VKM F-4513 (FW-928)]
MATTSTEKVDYQVKGRQSTVTTDLKLDNEQSAPNSPGLPENVDGPVSSSDSDDEPAPDGGARAWIVAAGGSAILFCCLGFANSFGTFEQYYLTHQLRGHSADKIAWIGSISAYLQFGAGMFGGPMFDRYGSRIMQPAAVVYVFAMMMLSLCKEYWQLMLVQGVLMGVAMGFLQFPAFAAVSQYFDKNRAAALGLVVSGSSIGGVVIPIALSKMLNSSLGFGWSVRVIGFLLIPLLTFACVAVRARLTSRTTPFWLSRAYTEPIFVLLMVSMFFVFMGMLTPLFYLPTYAVARGMDPTLAGYLLAIVNASSTFGRIIPGMLADKYGRLNVFALGGISTGIAIFCMNSARTNSDLIGYAIVFGFTSGTIISGLSACISLCAKDPRETGMYMGMGMSLSSLGGLIGPPVNGVFVHHYGGFFEACMFSGAVCLLGGLVAALIKIVTPQGILGRV